MAINPIIAMTLGYLGAAVLVFLVINFLTAGFLFTFMNVKGARGKKIMTNIYAVNRNYAKPGIVDSGWYIYTDGNKHEKRMKIPKGQNIFYRFLNITWVNVDEEKNTFISPEGREINGFDAEKYNNLYLRTLYAPSILDPKQQLQFILVIVTALMVLIILGLLGFIVIKKIHLILDNVVSLRSYFLSLNTTVV